jgi:uncharacterized protein (DUF1684 family)
MKSFLRILFILLISLWIACDKPVKEVDQEYVDQINEWHQNRVERLTSKTGWMSLAGLYWLKEGQNTFGTDSQNDIVFPAKKAPGFMGSIFLEDDVVKTKILPDVEVLEDSIPVKDIKMRIDIDGEPTILLYGTLSWYIIKRSDDFAVRLRDSANPVITSFHGIKRYPVDSSWRIEATFESYNPQRSISVPTILGNIAEEPSPGALVFKIENEVYRLDVIGNPDDKRFFVIFGDETNKDETYGAGRYVYVDNPGNNGKTFIDFNKCYNPPCAFTVYATCPFPPEQNILPVKITAGEKRYH